MPDVFAQITQAPPEALDVIANVLEMRAAIPQQQEMLRTYLREIAFPLQARVLEVGCGTGAVCRVLAQEPKVGEVVEVDAAKDREDQSEHERSLAPAKELDWDGAWHTNVQTFHSSGVRRYISPEKAER